MELLLGIICGIALSLFFSFGPAFFSLIQTSIQYGYRRAFPFAIGIFASDAVVVVALLIAFNNIGLNEAFLYNAMRNPWVASICAVIMVLMGISSFRKQAQESTLSSEGSQHRMKFRNKRRPKRREVFVNGFVLNFFNPMIWIFWVTVIVLISGEFGVKPYEMWFFFIGVLGATCGLDILKCKLSSMLQRIITAHFLNIINKVTGVILFLFAGYMLVSMLVFQLDPVASERMKENDRKGGKSTKMIKGVHNGLNKLPLKGDSSVIFHTNHRSETTNDNKK